MKSDWKKILWDVKCTLGRHAWKRTTGGAAAKQAEPRRTRPQLTSEKTKMKKAIISVLMTAGALSAPAFAAGIEPCLTNAAHEFGVPGKVLEAMRREMAGNKAKSPSYASREHGPMGVSELIILTANRRAGIDVTKAKTDACENYRVASWFLSDSMKRETGDVWEAVRTYYFGTRRTPAVQQSADKVVERIRKVADSI